MTTKTKKNSTSQIGWGERLLEKSFWIMLLLGFSAGVPILLVFGTLSVWLNEAGVSKSTITYFSWAGLGYGFKFVWAPLIDQARLPILNRLLGKRRSWLLLCQVLLLLILAAMALTNPVGSKDSLTVMALLAVALGFTSASQDIVIDAYRIEITPPDLLGMSASSYTLGYRLAMILAGAYALILSKKLGSTIEHYEYSAWQTTYLIMSALMLVGILTTLIISEPKNNKEALDTRGSTQLLILFIILLIPFIGGYYAWKYAIELLHSYDVLTFTSNLGPLGKFILTTCRFLFVISLSFVVARLLVEQKVIATDVAAVAYWSPIKEFVQRFPLKLIILILLLIGFYRVSDMVLGVVANVFYQDLGFEKDDIAYASKIFGVIVTIAGTFIGGFMITRFGVMRMLMIGAITSAVTNLLFVLLAAFKSDVSSHSIIINVTSNMVFSIKDTWALYAVIIADNIAGGIATIAFITFLSRLSNIEFTAMQYAIFTSCMVLLPSVLKGYSGTIVEFTNYQTFFIITTVIGLPVVWLVWIVGKQLTLKEDNG